jgi:DNA polymerase-1
MEQELLHIVVDMERSGVTLNVPLVKEFTQKLETEVEQLVSSIYTDVGHEFNISSPKQVGEVLFEEKHLPAKKKTKGGTYSTDERILRELIGVDPVVDKILRYRELTKLISTYLKPLPDFVNPKTGRIHAIFNQLGAVTGRFSSQNPNMQNIPLNDVQGIYLRKAFVAAPGTVWFAFDYSQQELRLLAELSGEEHMKQAFIEKEDIHARTAAEIFGIKPNKITKEQRKVGKTINFGIVYGMSAFGLSDRMKIPKARALEFIETYFGRYPKVKKYYDSLLARARADGYVETIMGRRRSAFDLNSSNYQLRQAVEREIMNFPLQGSAADIIKLAMVKVAPLLKKYPVRLLLQVHDELIFEYETSLSMKALEKDPQCLDFVREVRQTMLGIVQLDVPFEVEVEVGTDWTSMKKFNYVQ